ncbi:Phosphoenolpyruvate carboxykinase [ATP] [Phycisphaerae bacterium RAS2]|nr:Phosphoenolpyruvate carboxykinase [ATP] [Phycisphaerae bacterium RAS2]
MNPGKHGIDQHGLAPTRAVNWNLSVPELVERALVRGEGQLNDTGALCCLTGKRTGRSPNDKFIVQDDHTAKTVDWGKVNRPITPEVFEKLLKKTIAHLNDQELFVTDAWAGADEQYGMPIRLVGTKAWHSLFARQLFRRSTQKQMESAKPEYVILSAPDLHADPGKDGTNSEAFICADFTRRIILVAGTHYAGENKKSIFTVLNHTLPDRGVFPMHCSANVGPNGDVALFFGLSGTGKTTLSADPQRRLIGDDEHGWSDRGVFNFEGGCYAKCIRLSPEREPQIYNALRFGAVLENVVIDPATRAVDFDSDRYTENTRAAYPIDFIDNAIPEGRADAHPRAIVFLTCDAFGVMPPISRLSPEQAMYHFLSGYTAKLAGTEAGVGSEPQAAFSTCFGAPFMTRNPMVYANLLADRMKKHDAQCFLINTGWGGGPFGVGKRIDLASTRAMVHAALGGKLKEVETVTDPVFGLHIPTRVPEVEADILLPRKTWKDAAAYDAKAKHLAGLFKENFTKFTAATAEVKAAGPRG